MRAFHGANELANIDISQPRLTLVQTASGLTVAALEKRVLSHKQRRRLIRTEALTLAGLECLSWLVISKNDIIAKMITVVFSRLQLLLAL
jgi:hypothetical protein